MGHWGRCVGRNLWRCKWRHPFRSIYTKQLVAQRALGLKITPKEQKEMLHFVHDTALELQKNRGYLDEKDEKELEQRFEAWTIKRMKERENAQEGQKKEKEFEKRAKSKPFPDEDREGSEAYGYESSAEMDFEDEEA